MPAPGLALSVNPVTAVECQPAASGDSPPTFSHNESVVLQLLVGQWKKVWLRTIVCTHNEVAEERDAVDEDSEYSGFYLLQCEGSDGVSILEICAILLGHRAVVDAEVTTMRDYVKPHLGMSVCWFCSRIVAFCRT